MNSTNFGLTLLGAIVGLISWRSAKSTEKTLNDGHLRLEKTLEDSKAHSKEANDRLEKSLEDSRAHSKEANDRLEKSLEDSRVRSEEGKKQLIAMQQETNRMINEGNKRVEAMLSAMQTRWDQSDEFNKRMLDKILDRVA